MAKQRTPVMFQPKYFSKAGNIESNCAGSIFWNKGDTVAIIGGTPLVPNDFLILSVNADEIDETAYTVQFEPPTGGNNFLVVWQKVYKN